MEYLLIPIIRLAICLVGALDIRNAVVSFKNGHYYIGSANSMLAVWMVILLIDTYFGGIVT